MERRCLGKVKSCGPSLKGRKDTGFRIHAETRSFSDQVRACATYLVGIFSHRGHSQRFTDLTSLQIAGTRRGVLWLPSEQAMQ